MRRLAPLLTSAICTLALCSAAQAVPPNPSGTSTTPNGNGAVNQYLETVPTDHGNRPTNSLRGRGTHHSGGGGGVVGSGGGGTGGTGGTGAAGTGLPNSSGTGAGSSPGGVGGAIAPATKRALEKHGSAGQAAAALAQRTAPVVAGGHRDTTSQPSNSGGSSAIGSLVAALTGSASNGGLGTLLPVILVVALFGTAGMAILRRRRQT